MALALQRAFGRARALRRGPRALRCGLAPGLLVTLCALARAFRGRAFLRRREVHARTSRLRKADRDGLFRGACTVLAATDMLHLLLHELAGLRRGGLALALVLGGTIERCFPGHPYLRLVV